MKLKFCANLSFMYQEAAVLVERYRLAGRAGFRGVECASPYDSDLDELVRVKEELGLEQVLINVPTGDPNKGELGFAALPGREDAFDKSLNKAISYAKRLGCRRIHVMSGVVKRDPDTLKTFEANLIKAAAVLKSNEMVGLIEPINKYSLPGYFLNDYGTACEVVRRVDSPHLRLQLDVFHMQTITGNLTRNIEEMLPLVGHIQVAQVPNRNEPDTPGEVDYAYLFDLLTQLSYSGWIGLEYKPRSGTDCGLRWIKEFGYIL
ncbi:putative hydroxypyruvate isomerase [Cimex lectularius]|uniref:Putative hydroxypyruvate isomerase n=1 Tax=Cimex lectularius TaxID=79782 RepID=A0A8I6TGU1_CIMLE|nr:putative hydroxypyruvate isomerase [Cimex lectularius]